MDQLTKDTATEALHLQIELDSITQKLENIKDQLRDIASGETTKLVIDGLGKINITAPRAGSEKTELEINEDKLNKSLELRRKLISAGIAKEVLVVDINKLADIPDLKQKLIDKGIMHAHTKMVAAAKASVRIQPNV